MSAKVSGYSHAVQVTPTVSTSPAYTAGDQVGGIQTLTGACLSRGSVSILYSLTIIDKAKQNVELDLFFFDQLPTIASSDNAAFDLTDANMALSCVGVVNVPSSAYKNSSSNSCASVLNVGLAIKCGSTDVTKAGDLYVVAVTRGTPTYASTSDLVFKYVFAQDGG